MKCVWRIVSINEHVEIANNDFLLEIMSPNWLDAKFIFRIFFHKFFNLKNDLRLKNFFIYFLIAKIVHGIILEDKQNSPEKDMGTIFFSQQNNNLENIKTDFESKLNNNVDTASKKKSKEIETKQMRKRKCQCGTRKH